jgi:hypothetical protein
MHENKTVTKKKMTKKQVAIVIPIYKKNLTDTESQAYLQCLKIFNKRDLFLVCPQSLDTTIYKNVAIKKKITLIHKRFSDKYFNGIEGYNKLMLSLNFYKSFKDYEYIQIYQLDAWVFRDELDYWCDKGYDYIGAPWISEDLQEKKIIGIGNGGFSLRRVESAIKVLSTHKRIYSIPMLWTKEKSISYNLNGRIGSYLKILKALFFVSNNCHYLFNDYDDNEDIFWGERAKGLFTWYKIPSEEIAMKFAFEKHPTLLFEKNNSRLPFGCHAWEKYEPKFWSKYLDHLSI